MIDAMERLATCPDECSDPILLCAMAEVFDHAQSPRELMAMGRRVAKERELNQITDVDREWLAAQWRISMAAIRGPVNPIGEWDER